MCSPDVNEGTEEPPWRQSPAGFQKHRSASVNKQLGWSFLTWAPRWGQEWSGGRGGGGDNESLPSSLPRWTLKVKNSLKEISWKTKGHEIGWYIPYSLSCGQDGKGACHNTPEHHLPHTASNPNCVKLLCSIQEENLRLCLVLSVACGDLETSALIGWGEDLAWRNIWLQAEMLALNEQIKGTVHLKSDDSKNGS